MPVSFRIESFEGPLDLLLQLVEKQELDLSTVSLAKVADQFVTHVKETPNLPLDEIADFLVVATKLMYLKSKLLVPQLETSPLEDGPSLEEQLRRYRAFVDVSKTLARMWASDAQSFPRAQRPLRMREIAFVAPEGVTPEILRNVMQRVVARLEPLLNMPRAAVERVVSIQEMIGTLLHRVRSAAHTSFRSCVGNGERAHKIVSFLALLELVKQQFVRAKQDVLFHDILIESHPDAPSRDPFAHSYV